MKTQEIKEILDNLFVLYQQNKSKTQILNELGIEEISETPQAVTLIPNFEEDGLIGKMTLTISNNDNNEVFPFKLLISNIFGNIKVGYFINDYSIFFNNESLFNDLINFNLTNNDNHKVKFKKGDEECTYFDFLDYMRTKNDIGVQEGVQNMCTKDDMCTNNMCTKDDMCTNNMCTKDDMCTNNMCTKDDMCTNRIKQKIEVYDTSNNLVGTFASIYETANTLGIERRNIYKVLKGQRKSLKGYTFKLIKY